MATPKKTGRRLRYNKSDKLAAIHAMKEDAKSRSDGRPNLADVSKATGVSRGSLRTWWAAYKAGKFDEMADRQDQERPRLELPPLPGPICEMTPGEFAGWRLDTLQRIAAYSATVGNFTAISGIDKRMSDHQQVVVSERERQRPAADRLEMLRERCEAAGLI